jgi:hypothetical protein
MQAMKFIITQFSSRSVFLLLGPNILNTLLSKTLSLCSSQKVRDQASHPYSTTGKITPKEKRHRKFGEDNDVRITVAYNV